MGHCFGEISATLLAYDFRDVSMVEVAQSSQNGGGSSGKTYLSLSVTRRMRTIIPAGRNVNKELTKSVRSGPI